MRFRSSSESITVQVNEAYSFMGIYVYKLAVLFDAKYCHVYW
jgi:hypothetical protein